MTALHGSTHHNLGGPYSRLSARSTPPIVTPSAPYELTGSLGNVIFNNGHVAGAIVT